MKSQQGQARSGNQHQQHWHEAVNERQPVAQAAGEAYLHRVERGHVEKHDQGRRKQTPWSAARAGRALRQSSNPVTASPDADPMTPTIARPPTRKIRRANGADDDQLHGPDRRQAPGRGAEAGEEMVRNAAARRVDGNATGHQAAGGLASTARKTADDRHEGETE